MPQITQDDTQHTPFSSHHTINQTMKQILTGHTSPATAYKVEDYPYGYTLRTSIFYWIESKKGKGDRFCSMTVNPKNGRLNAPKVSTYAPVMYMFLNDDGHVKWGQIHSYDSKEFAQKFAAIAPAIVPSLNDIQIDNLRMNYAGSLHASAVWALVKYSPEARPAFKRWLSDTIVHVMNCNISELVNHPAAPAPDKPDEEVKMIVTESFIIGGTDPRYTGGKPVTEDYGGYKGHEAY